MSKQSDASSIEVKAAKARPIWEIRLYVAGESSKSIAAISNLRRLCEKHLAGSYRIEIVDLMKHPELARSDHILAVPTLVRKLPHPIRRLIGNLSSAERVFTGLEISQVERLIPLPEEE